MTSFGGDMVGSQGTGQVPKWGQPAQQVGGFQTGGYQYGMPPTTAVDTSKVAGAQMPNMSVGQGESYQQNMQDAYWNQAKSRLDPQWDQRMDSEQTRLANMGFSGNSAARSQDMGDLYRGRNDAYGSAMNSAILNSGAEGQRRQGMDIAAGNFGNQATQQNFENQLTSQQAQNAASGQEFNQGLQSAQLNNDALGKQQQIALGYDSNASSRYGADASAGASRYGSSLANQAANRGLDINQAQHEFDNSRTMAYDIPGLQDAYARGFNPNDPTFGQGNQPGAPNQGGWADRQIGVNNQIGAGVSDFTGKFLANPPSFGGNGLNPGVNNPDPYYGGVGNINPSAFGGGF